MNNKSFRRAMALALIPMMALGAFMLTGCGKSYNYTYGDVEWLSTYKDRSSDKETRTIKDTFYYSDDWFADNPSSENKELALASMQLIASCVSDADDSPGAACLRSMGFEEVGTSNFASSDPDDCNYTWARKTVGDRTLVAVVMQSVNREWKLRNKVWKQNVTVNDPDSTDPSGEHYAYSKAVDKVIGDIASLGGDGASTYWIMGQSRGGGIANVLAARLPGELPESKIFAYTFEAPMTVDAGSVSGDCKYIHNYVCSDDIVTLIPVWGMTRYGVMHDLKTKETDKGLADELAALGSSAADMKERIYTPDVTARLAANCKARVPSRAEYSAERTDSWTDADGAAHSVTYSYQDALIKLMDLVFREDDSVSILDGLSGKKKNLEGAIDHLTEGVKTESGGGDPAAEYWEATEGLYSVLKEVIDGELPVSEEDLYKVVRLAGPVLIEIPEEGGDPDTELLTDVIGYNRELIYSHQFDTIIARLKILAPAPGK